MTNLSKLLLLIFWTLFIFYTSIFAEVSLLDDREMLKSLSSAENFNLINVFFPQGQGGMYYRPLIHLSYLIDRFVWNLNPAIMHFENVLLHLANTLLVYYIAQQVLHENANAKKWFPFVAALLFSVHPVATESVNWISGRTDLLSTFFVLFSCYIVFRARNLANFGVNNYTKIFYILWALFLLLMGILAKEPAIGFIPAMVFILFSKNDKIHKSTLYNVKVCLYFVLVVVASLSVAIIFYNYLVVIAITVCYGVYLAGANRADEDVKTKYRQYIMSILVSMFVILGVFWGIRKIVFASQSSHIARTLDLLFADINYTLSVFLKAYGFYVKKFFIPLPLNFVIREVNIIYSLVGIIVLCAVMVMITRRRTADMLAITGLCMIAPVLPLTFDSIAWTSYAERYVYPASPFWILSITSYLSPLAQKNTNSYVKAVAPLLLIAFFSYITFNRNLIWQTNIGIFGDSVDKTPSYKQLYGLYMTSLYEGGLYDEVARQYQIAKFLPVITFKKNNFDLFYARVLIKQSKYDEAEQFLANFLATKKEINEEYYEILFDLSSGKLNKLSSYEEKKHIISSMIEYKKKWYVLTEDPLHLYQLGQLYLSINDKKAAQSFFEKAYKNLSPDSYYRDAAGKLSSLL